MANKNTKLREVLLNNVEYLIDHVFQKRVNAVDEQITKLKSVLDNLDGQMKTITTEYREQIFDPNTLDIKAVSGDDKDIMKYTEDFKSLQDKKRPIDNEFKKLLEQKGILETPLHLLQSLHKAKKSVQDKQMAITGTETYISMNGRFENVDEEEKNLDTYNAELKVLETKLEQEIINCLDNTNIKNALEQLIHLLQNTRSRRD
ncbi:MAG: hypothetical protein IKP24_02205 [Alphaproteobacteria bacterium]|nr:hypothetical protein [Alphaproteobacteria bacterium]